MAEHFLERLKSPFFVEILIRSCFCLKERGVRTRPMIWKLIDLKFSLLPRIYKYIFWLQRIVTYYLLGKFALLCPLITSSHY